MMKLTKRKGFNFFRSYYDVYNELSDKDKIRFMDALLDRQFLGVKQKELKGMAKFAYISQTNSIDNQVKGYVDKFISLRAEGKTKGDPFVDPADGGLLPPADGGLLPPALQVEEEVEEKGKEEEQVTEICNFACPLFPIEIRPKKPDKLWIDTIEKLIRIDGKQPEEIKAVIKWARSNDFWSKNFLSLAKLRKPNPEKVKYYDVFNENMKAESNGASTKGIPQEPDKGWINTVGKDKELYQQACKIWRGNGWSFRQIEGSAVRRWLKK